MPTIGLGPHGERAFPADKLILTEEEAELARPGRISADVVLHTTSSDWSRQELAGIIATLGQNGATVSEIVDCGFDKERQNRELRRLAAPPQAAAPTRRLTPANLPVSSPARGAHSPLA